MAPMSIGCGIGIPDLGNMPFWASQYDANNLQLYLDFEGGQYMSQQRQVAESDILSVTRASSGYAEKLDGTLVEFGVNELRRTDKGALVEEARTNLPTYTWPDATVPTDWTDFGGGAKTLVTTEKGLQGLRFNGTSVRPRISQNITLVTSTTYTLSVYVDSGASISVGGQKILEMKNLSDATGTLVASLGDQGSDGRISITFTTGTDTSGTIQYGPGIDGNVTCDITMGGLQCETGSTASSYIKTTSAAATRAADIITTSNVDFLNQAIGTLAIQAEILNIDTTQVYLSLDARIATKRINAFSNAISGSMQLYGDCSGSIFGPVTPSETLSNGDIFKSSFAYKLNDNALVVNGGTAAKDTNFDPESGVDFTTIAIGNDFNQGNVFNGYVKKVNYWDVRQSNANLQTITT